MARFDHLKPGTRVIISATQGRDPVPEEATFLGIKGKGADRTVRLRTPARGSVAAYEWEGYRWGNRWVYGSSGDPLRLLEVIAEPS